MSSQEGGEKTTQPGLSPTEGTYGVHLGEPHLALSTCHSRPFLQVPIIGGRCCSKQGEATGEGKATGLYPLSPVTGWCVKAWRIASMLHTVLQAMKSAWLILSPRTRRTSFESQGNHGRVLRALGGRLTEEMSEIHQSSPFVLTEISGDVLRSPAGMANLGGP